MLKNRKSKDYSPIREEKQSFIHGAGIYVHIPFCIQFCRYCDFNKSLRHLFSREDLANYQNALLKEIDYYFSLFPEIKVVRSIYFGGGTPSLYPKEMIGQIIEIIGKKAIIPSDAEITMEVDPKTIRKRSLLQLKSNGINRVSLGAQTFQDDLLTILGRYHKRKDILECYWDCRETGYKNISMDFIYGIPKQTESLWRDDLFFVFLLQPEHISLYNLNIARGTDFFRERNKLSFPSEQKQVDFYRLARAELKKVGIVAYEISNFAKKGFESKHNMDCWNLYPYLGIGAGASSYNGQYRWKNVNRFDLYVRHINNQNNFSFSRRLRINERQQKLEFVMLKLRKTSGFRRNEYKNRFGEEVEKDFPFLSDPQIKPFIKLKNNIKFTAKGIPVSNEIFQELF